jgi:hypothetical protein
MNLYEAMAIYFRGERNLGFGLVALGAVLLGVALWVWRTQAGPFAWALIVPLALVGVGVGIGGVAFAHKSEVQLATLTAALEAHPAALVAAETARMEKVNANWPRLELTWGVVTLVALVLLLGVKREWSAGLGLALMVLATALFFIDVFAERRAGPYTEALGRAGAEPPSRGRP